MSVESSISHVPHKYGEMLKVSDPGHSPEYNLIGEYSLREFKPEDTDVIMAIVDQNYRELLGKYHKDNIPGNFDEIVKAKVNRFDATLSEHTDNLLKGVSSPLHPWVAVDKIAHEDGTVTEEVVGIIAYQKPVGEEIQGFLKTYFGDKYTAEQLQSYIERCASEQGTIPPEADVPFNLEDIVELKLFQLDRNHRGKGLGARMNRTINLIAAKASNNALFYSSAYLEDANRWYRQGIRSFTELTDPSGIEIDGYPASIYYGNLPAYANGQ